MNRFVFLLLCTSPVWAQTPTVWRGGKPVNINEQTCRCSLVRRAPSSGPAHLPAALATSLLSWYSFEGNANDVAGTNNGTVVGTITYGATYGVHGQGAHLAIGSGGSFVSFPTPYATTTAGTFTLAIWAKTSAGGHVFDGSTSTWRAFGIDTFSNSVFASVGGNGSSHGFAGYGWHLWVVAFGSDGSLAVYCDGVVDPSLGTWSVAALQNLAFMGHYSGNNALDYVGDIDDAAVWKDRKFTAAEALQLYNGGAGYTYP